MPTDVSKVYETTFLYWKKKHYKKLPYQLIMTDDYAIAMQQHNRTDKDLTERIKKICWCNQ